MASEMQALVREMLPGERADIEDLINRSLGLVDRIFFLLSFEDALKGAQKQGGGSLVAVFNDRIVGSVSMRVQHMGGERAGFIDALVADRALRGRGVGGSLVDGAISWLEERKCEVIYATADRYNSSSWNTFVHRGFSVYEFPQQFRDYGLVFLRLWLVEFHYIGYGTFFLRRDGEEEKIQEKGEMRQFIAAWLALSLMLWMRALRMDQPMSLLPVFFVVAGISLLAHELPQKIVGRLFGLETAFKAWEPGLLLGLLLGAVGSIFPAYGSTYVKQLDWRYDPKETGFFFAVGPFVSLVFAFMFWALSSFTSSSLLSAAGRAGYVMNLVNVVFNLIPVQAAGGFVWDGKKILAWNKTVWLMLIAGTALLVIIDVFF